MKNKLLVTLLISFIILTGCGKKNEEITNKVNLSIDKSIYAKEERIEVSIDPNKLDKTIATMVIVKSTAKYDSESVVHNDNYSYSYLSDFDEMPMHIFAPSEEGKYDVRIYENNDGGKCLGSISFEVKDGNSEEEDNIQDECYRINENDMDHFQIAGFNVDEKYCIYEYDYRDYVDTIKIFYVADEIEQIRAAQYIFDKSGSYESLDDGKRISSIEDAKYFVDASYKFVNDTYTYTIKLQKEAEEENPFNDLSIKANSIIIEITPRGR